jgi:hypothetical protein
MITATDLAVQHQQILWYGSPWNSSGRQGMWTHGKVFACWLLLHRPIKPVIAETYTTNSNTIQQLMHCNCFHTESMSVSNCFPGLCKATSLEWLHADVEDHCRMLHVTFFLRWGVVPSTCCVNSQNSRVWPKETRHAAHKIPLHSIKIAVWFECHTVGLLDAFSSKISLPWSVTLDMGPKFLEHLTGEETATA